MSRRERGGQASGSGVGEMLRSDCAGIDIGSTSHFVAVPAGRSPDGDVVREFGCVTPELRRMAVWLRACGVREVAMESTGVYWVPVFEALEAEGFAVSLVDARRAKSLPARKSDVQDCQWLQELHSFGLIHKSFVPPRDISILRTYTRGRAAVVEECSRQILLMQKALEQMNLHLHKVLSDISGVTGMKILRAIIEGERDPHALAALREPLTKRSEADIAAALTGSYREDHLFSLAQAVARYEFFQKELAAYDERIERHLHSFAAPAPRPGAEPPLPPKTPHRRKNQPHFDLKSELFRVTGVDLTKIPGISSLTAQIIVAEVGIDMTPFPSEKHFASWLGLCPHNRVSGKRVMSSHTKKCASKAASALRLSAQALHKSKTFLGCKYRKLRARLGAPKAITAIAHQLARIIYRMLKHGEPYVEAAHEKAQKIYHERQLKNLTKNAKLLGFSLVPLENCALTDSVS